MHVVIPSHPLFCSGIFRKERLRRFTMHPSVRVEDAGHIYIYIYIYCRRGIQRLVMPMLLNNSERISVVQKYIAAVFLHPVNSSYGVTWVMAGPLLDPVCKWPFASVVDVHRIID